MPQTHDKILQDQSLRLQGNRRVHVLPNPGTRAPRPSELPAASMRSARLANWPSEMLYTKLEARTVKTDSYLMILKTILESFHFRLLVRLLLKIPILLFSSDNNNKNTENIHRRPLKAMLIKCLHKLDIKLYFWKRFKAATLTKEVRAGTMVFTNLPGFSLA